MNQLRTTKKIRTSLNNLYIESLWKGQKKYCPYCQRMLLPHEKKDAAHIKAASNLGNADVGNIVLAHNDCNIGTDTIKLVPPLKRYILY